MDTRDLYYLAAVRLRSKAHARAPHTLDISTYVTVTSEIDLLPTLPATAKHNLMSSAALVLTDQGPGRFSLDTKTGLKLC